jgi:hypothetical protein
MTTTSISPTPADATRSRTAAGLVSLVAGAVVLALSRVLATEGGSPHERLSQMHDHDVQAAASALLGVLGFMALIPGFLAVTALVRRRGARVATVGAALMIVGCVGFAILVSVDASTLAASKVSDTDAMAKFLHQLDVSTIILPLTPPAVIGYFVGPFLVTLGARRAGIVPAWLPYGVLASLVIQPVGAGIGGPVVAHMLDAVCQLLFVAMVAILARHTWRAFEQVG